MDSAGRPSCFVTPRTSVSMLSAGMPLGDTSPEALEFLANGDESPPWCIATLLVLGISPACITLSKSSQVVLA